MRGWLPTMPTTSPSSRAKTDDEVLGEVLLDLHEAAYVDHRPDRRLHVVGLVRVFRDERLQHPVATLRVVGRRDRGWSLPVASRQVGEEPADAAEGFGLRLVEKVGDATADVVDLSAAELVEADLLTGRHPDHLRPGDEHVAEVLDHEDEIRDRRRVDGAAGCRVRRSPRSAAPRPRTEHSEGRCRHSRPG